MSEQQDTLGGGNVPEQQVGEKTPDQLQQELQAANQATTEARLHAQLMADPEISQILRARAAKKKVRIVEDDGGYRSQSIADEVAPPPSEEKKVDLDNMSNTQLFQHLAHEQAKNTEKMLSKMLSPFQEQVSQLQQLTTAQLNEKSRSEVDNVRKLYPDFDKHRDVMLGLVNQNPNLNAKQLYFLAKAQAGEPVVEARQMGSERPGSVTTRPPARTERKTPLKPGMLGMKELIQEATGRLTGSGILSKLDEDDAEVGD